MADWATIGPDRLLRFGRHVFRAQVGRTGITRQKQEGDGATPAGRMPLRRVLYRADRIARPKTILLAEPIAPRDGWCDDPADPNYNMQVRLPYAASHEELWRTDGQYDLIGVLGWNDRPPVRGLGSAIFLHVAAADGGPTVGCVALALADLHTLLAEGLAGIDAVAG